MMGLQKLNKTDETLDMALSLEATRPPRQQDHPSSGRGGSSQKTKLFKKKNDHRDHNKRSHKGRE